MRSQWAWSFWKPPTILWGSPSHLVKPHEKELGLTTINSNCKSHQEISLPAPSFQVLKLGSQTTWSRKKTTLTLPSLNFRPTEYMSIINGGFVILSLSDGPLQHCPKVFSVPNLALVHSSCFNTCSIYMTFANLLFLQNLQLLFRRVPCPSLEISHAWLEQKLTPLSVGEWRPPNSERAPACPGPQKVKGNSQPGSLASTLKANKALVPVSQANIYRAVDCVAAILFPS